MKHAIWARVACLCLVLGAGRAAATTFTVLPGGGGDYPDIHTAILAAADGDVILLGDGEFTGAGNCDFEVVGRDISIVSMSGDPTLCVVDAGGTLGWRFLDCFVTVEGVTITDGAPCLQVASTSWVDPHRLEVRNCMVTGGTVGIDVRASTLLVEDSTVEGNGTGVSITEEAGHCNLVRTRVTGNTGDGIYAYGHETVRGWEGLLLEECEIDHNDGDGVFEFSLFGGTTAVDCHVHHNLGWGYTSGGGGDYGLTLDGGIVEGNELGGINMGGSMWNIIRDAEILGNGGQGIAAGYSALCLVGNCDIHHNTGHGVTIPSGGKRLEDLSTLAIQYPVSVENCRIYANGGRGVNLASSTLFNDNRVFGCVIYDNTAEGIGIGAACDGGHELRIFIQSSTIVGNAHGLRSDTLVPVFVEQTIIAFNHGAAVISHPDNPVQISCSDLYGNPDGDWTPDIFDQVDLRGNFSVDPCFCDPANAVFTLCGDSRCQPDRHPWGCTELVGALGLGCSACGCPAVVANEERTDEDDGDGVVPAAGIRLGAHPNPFNPRTTLTFVLERAGSVELAVFDVQGRRVRVVRTGEFTPGAHTATWDGRDGRGRELPSGTYLVRCRTDNFVTSRKVTLMQ